MASGSRLLSVGLLSAALLIAIIWVLSRPTGDLGPLASDATPHRSTPEQAGIVPSESSADALAQGTGQSGEVQRVAADRWSVHDGAFVLQGKIRMPYGEAMPPEVKVVVHRREQTIDGTARALPKALRQNEHVALADPESGEFEILLPRDALDHSWRICAGGLGWAGAEIFPSPLPQSPEPTEVQFVDLAPIFAATFELRRNGGGEIELAREWLRANGGLGVYQHGGWSVNHPSKEDSVPALLSVPPDFAPVIGGRAPDRGLGGAEAGLIWRDDEQAWERGFLDLPYSLELPGYRAVKQELRFGRLARGEVPHHVVELEPLLPAGELLIAFESVDWWREEVERFGLGGIQIDLRCLDPPPLGSESLHASGPSPGGHAGKSQWLLQLDGIPDSGELRVPGLPIGRYLARVTCSETGVELPLSQREWKLSLGERTTIIASLADLGVVELKLDPSQDSAWSVGRFQVVVQAGADSYTFGRVIWPMRLGPLPVQEVEVLLRARDQKRPLRKALRADGIEGFAVLARQCSSYFLAGTRDD